jgi:hypothetical protein
VLTALAVLLALPACTPDFDEVWLVKDLRILAIRADPPEVLVDEIPATFPKVDITALVVDPTDPDQVVDWELWGCPAAESSCEEADRRWRIAQNRTRLDQIQAEVHLDRSFYQIALEDDQLRGLGGVPVLVELRIRGKAREERGVKRLVYGTVEPPLPQDAEGAWGGPCRSSAPECDQGTICDRSSVTSRCLKRPNENPSITEVLDATDDTSKEPVPTAGWQVVAEEVITLDPVSPEEDKEPYITDTLLKGTKELEEFLSYAFFVTAGELSHALTGGRPSPFVELKKTDDLTSEWTPEDPAASDANPTAASPQIWIVVRDDRGGVGWTSLSATVNPDATN